MTDRRSLLFLPLTAPLALAACMRGHETATRSDIDALAVAISGLGPEVDPVEAARAAEVAYAYTAVLRDEYQIVDPPLIHNTKVNLGTKPRGLCWHWAEDMEMRLNTETFATLRMHRAIANAENPFRIAHSTAIIARIGDDWDDGVVLDPWRLGGTLTWVSVQDDLDRYPWEPRNEVLERKLRRLAGDRTVT